jgi:lipoyl-dependent peroxiredoxin
MKTQKNKAKMKTLFTAEAVSKGGRSGKLESPDGLLGISLGNPLEEGLEKRGPNPEMLFAGAYAACFNGALGNAAKKSGVSVENRVVRALVSLLEDDREAYHLAVELQAVIPGLERAQVQHLMEEAHQTCPYSKALRGEAMVTLVADLGEGE